jgi:hypothetical protein
VIQITTQVAIAGFLSTALFVFQRRTVVPRVREGSIPLWLGVVLMNTPLAAAPVWMMLLGMVGVGVDVPLLYVVALVLLCYLPSVVTAGAIRYHSGRRQQ